MNHQNFQVPDVLWGPDKSRPGSTRSRTGLQTVHSLSSANRQDVTSCAFVPRAAAKLTIKKADRTEISLEYLTKSTPPMSAVLSSLSLVQNQKLIVQVADVILLIVPSCKIVFNGMLSWNHSYCFWFLNLEVQAPSFWVIFVVWKSNHFQASYLAGSQLLHLRSLRVGFPWICGHLHKGM